MSIQACENISRKDTKDPKRLPLSESLCVLYGIETKTSIKLIK
jgi:hypothetical protein